MAHLPEQRCFLLHGSLAAALFAGLALAACAGGSGASGTTPSAAPAPPALPAEPQALFAQLEQRLLDSEALAIAFDVASSPPFQSALTGTLETGANQRADLAFHGTFGSETVDVSLSADGSVMTLEHGAVAQRRQDIPPALREGLLLGLTRMGLLHNMAMLIASRPPDGTDGHFRDWVQVTGFAWAGEQSIAGRRAAGIHFRIIVGGEPAGEATLWVDASTGLPLLREQTVDFSAGSMSVTERYPRFELRAPAGG